jgi:hypothetical protein
LLLLTLVGMVLTRDAVRRHSLAQDFSLDQLQTAPQWGLTAAFGVFFVLALAVVFWMIRVYAQAAGTKDSA